MIGIESSESGRTGRFSEASSASLRTTILNGGRCAPNTRPSRRTIRDNIERLMELSSPLWPTAFRCFRSPATLQTGPRFRSLFSRRAMRSNISSVSRDLEANSKMLRAACTRVDALVVGSARSFISKDPAAPEFCWRRAKAWLTASRRACRYASWKSGISFQRRSVLGLTPIELAASSMLRWLNKAAMAASCLRGSFAPWPFIDLLLSEFAGGTLIAVPSPPKVSGGIALLSNCFRVITCHDRVSAAQRKTIMTTFTIDSDNNITAFGTPEEAAATTATPFDTFASQKELAQLAAAWPAERLVAIWNSFAGVVAVENFKSTKTAVSRIWARIQSLGEERRVGKECRSRRSPYHISK